MTAHKLLVPDTTVKRHSILNLLGSKLLDCISTHHSYWPLFYSQSKCYCIFKAKEKAHSNLVKDPESLQEKFSGNWALKQDPLRLICT